MDLTEKFIRKPFVVHGLEITESNIGEIAEILGELKQGEDGRQYIHLTATTPDGKRKLVPMVDKAYVGWFVTQLGDKYRCFNPKSFHGQFMDYASPIAWMFGDDDAPTQMDREGWNYQLATLASNDDIEAELQSYREADDVSEAVDEAPVQGIDVTDEILQAREDPPLTLNTEARPAEDIAQDAAPVDYSPTGGVVGRKRDQGLGLAVD